jgi:2-polyprenyl-3-methyl-5-hydroxy-6-metoxy-1,4-benzoquinol methylase
MTPEASRSELAAQSLLSPPGRAADWRLVLLVDAAADAGLLETLPGTAPDLAGRLGLDATAVRVVLDALVAGELVIREEGDRYVAGPAAPHADEVAVLRHHARAIRNWSSRLPDRLRGVVPERRPVEAETFVAALGSNARRVAPATVDRCLEHFPDARRVLDLGGGHGEYAAEFARRGLDVTLQDLSPMIEVVRAAGRIEAEGVTLLAGDFFEVLPEGPFDLIFCAGVTHTLSPERNAALYPRLRPLLAPAGGLAVITLLRHRNAMAALFAVQMLANARGGDTHDEAEYRRWLAAAGFGTVEVHDIDDRAQSLITATL